MDKCLLSSIVGLIIGGIITWFAAMFYYKKASDDLVKVADELRDLSEFIIEYQLADKGSGTIVPRLKENGAWTLDKYIGTSPPVGARDQWNRRDEIRKSLRELRGKRRKWFGLFV